ncbi:hypothetical protein ACFQ9V_05440 [Leifsonia sp. NPDC056665]|uniref:hypothetical protein n=1 Tax=Leifsonia sp. NPDC056665 TaxID=3345901 RepID=UPI0036A50496
MRGASARACEGGSYDDQASDEAAGERADEFADLAGGIDLSLLSSVVVAGVLYGTLLAIFPEPRYVFGPEGPRGVRSADAVVPPIHLDERSAAARAHARRAKGRPLDGHTFEQEAGA